MKKWNLIIDVEKGVDFINAVLSAKDEYVGNNHPGYSAPVALESSDIVTLERKVRGQTPMVDAVNVVRMCNHCDNAPCLEVGGEAVRKRDDGIMIIDPEKAVGRKDIVDACPHNAVVWNEELQLPQIWVFDAHLLDQGWDKPRCVSACATGGIEAVKISDEEMQRRVSEEGLETLNPELDTRPRVYYRNLYRYNTCFLSGTVVASIEGTEDCLEGATATLVLNGSDAQQTQTSVFGEFKIDRLEPGLGACEVRIEHPDYQSITIPAEITDSVYLGVIPLQKR
ncbi:MAG: 4Fe-4S dicluster domain-containing protein [Pseudomonadota bacterium]